VVSMVTVLGLGSDRRAIRRGRCGSVRIDWNCLTGCGRCIGIGRRHDRMCGMRASLFCQAEAA
jgi:hypothetical protein